MKEIAKLIGVLTLICVACSALLAAVYEKTRAPIEAAAGARRLEAARAVIQLPPEAPAPQPAVIGGVTNNDVFVAWQDGRVVATAIEGRSPNGYGGDIELMVGISAVSNTVIDYRVLQASETPGLGTKIAAPLFMNGIRGRPLDAKWKVRKDGGDVDAITAATISSRAACEAIRAAIDRHRDVLAALNPAP